MKKTAEIRKFTADSEKTPAVVVSDEAPVTGYLDSIVGREMSGWAKAREGAVFVRAYEDGKLIAEGEPSLFRRDLGGDHGFKISLPMAFPIEDLFDGKLSVFLESSDGATKEPIGINGELFSDAAIASFVKHLPSIKLGKLHGLFFKIHERFSASGENEERSTHNVHLLDYARQTMGGFLESIDGNILIGWAKGIGMPVMVRAYRNRMEIGAVEPHIHRPDVGGINGFRLQLTPSDLEAKINAGEIRIFVETIDGLHRRPIIFRRDLLPQSEKR